MAMTSENSDFCSHKLRQDTCAMEARFCDERMVANARSIHSEPTIVSKTCANLVEAIQFILSNNNQSNNGTILTESQVEIFEIIEQLRLCPTKMYMYAIKKFADNFNIHLYIIGYHQGKLELINKYHSTLENNKESMAFLLFNEDHTVNGALYIEGNQDIKQTVFSSKEITLYDVFYRLEQLNDTKSAANINQLQQCQDTSIFQPVNEGYAAEFSNRTESHYLPENLFRQFFQLCDGLSLSRDTMFQVFNSHMCSSSSMPQDIIEAMKNWIGHLSILTQEAQSTLSKQADHVPISQSVIPHPANAKIITSSTSQATISSEKHNEAPQWIIRPRNQEHKRNFQEFFNKECTLVGTNNPEGIHPRIKTPPNDGIPKILEIAILTVDNTDHPTKVIIPHGTIATDMNKLFLNDLGGLNLSNCKNVEFISNNGHIYLKIGEEEYKAKYIELLIYVISKYINKGSTKGISLKSRKEKQLHKCKLASWFCVFENGEYKRLSGVTYSDDITDKSQPYAIIDEKIWRYPTYGIRYVDSSTGQQYSIINTCSLDSALFALYFAYRTNIDIQQHIGSDILAKIESTFALVETEGWGAARIDWLKRHNQLQMVQPPVSEELISLDMYGSLNERVFCFITELQQYSSIIECTRPECKEKVRRVSNTELSIRLGDENIEDFELSTNGTCASMMKNQTGMCIDGVDEARNWRRIVVENLEANDTELMREWSCNGKTVVSSKKFDRDSPPFVIVNYINDSLITKAAEFKNNSNELERVKRVLTIGHVRYNLCAVINHSKGKHPNGHFTAILIDKNNKLYLFDDLEGVQQIENSTGTIETGIYTRQI
ncbi:unnamed protein product [Rotaria socialis]|uniref:Uncharacterized protein n=2 Tax=Rotaria socialis TaxID=392032 RepID=A0A817YL41_9BILA|nr:unnamed protein product [Rotaria socialis]CAF3400793.1 unnamed protein product [Rotaria socialis]CAF4289345.1 unnamed protein product [Rotaria socialis]CAF4632327.1 unnamed protein product [Rotaria socialis]